MAPTGLRHRESWAGLRFTPYVRISEDESDDRLKVATQEAVQVALARAKGADIVAAPPEYRNPDGGVAWCDNSISASRFSKKERKAWKALISFAMQNGVDIVGAIHFDRCFRRGVDLEPWIEDYAAGVVPFAFYFLEVDLDLTTEGGRMQARMMVMVSSMESENISRRAKWANLQRAEAGQKRKGRRGFGWRDEDTPHPGEAKVLRKAWKDLLAGSSVRSIALEWEERGVTKPYPADENGNGTVVPKWSQRTASVVAMLTNPRHVGDLRYGGDVWKHDNYPTRLIERPEYEAVLARLDAMKVAPGSRRPPRRSAFTGLITCGRCESAAMQVNSAHGKAVLRCTRCSCQIQRDPVTAMLWAKAWSMLASPAFLAALTAKGDVDLDDLKAEWKFAEDKLAETETLHDDGTYGTGEYKRKRLQWTKRRDDAAHAMAARTHHAELVRLALAAQTSDTEGGDGATVAAEVQRNIDLQRLILDAVYDWVRIEPAAKRGTRTDVRRVKVGFTSHAAAAEAAQ